MIREFVKWIKDPEAPEYFGFILALLIGTVSFVKAYGYRLATYKVLISGIKISVVIRGSIFKKILDSSTTALNQMTLGRVMTIVASDEAIIQSLIFFLNSVIVLPFIVVPLMIIILVEFGILASLVVPVFCTAVIIL